MRKPPDTVDPDNILDVTIKVPDREPYEGKATQKQKSWLWHNGVDTKDIDNLGKKQASAVIQQLERKREVERKIRANRNSQKGLLIAAIIIGIIYLLYLVFR